MTKVVNYGPNAIMFGDIEGCGACASQDKLMKNNKLKFKYININKVPKKYKNDLKGLNGIPIWYLPQVHQFHVGVIGEKGINVGKIHIGLKDLATKIPTIKGIDTNEVLEAAGTKWNFLKFKPGLVGGHCIGVDPYYLTHAAEQVKYNPQLILAGRRINDNMPIYMVKKILQKMIVNGIEIKNSTIGLMGITFKENVADIRNSKVADVVHGLKEFMVNVHVADPYADSSEVNHEYGIELTQSLSPASYDAVIVAVAHDEYRQLNADFFRSVMREIPLLIDLKNLYTSSDFENIERWSL
jgi:UDP-N-acetyl-D-mannosaminuronate dehydrogenase